MIDVIHFYRVWDLEKVKAFYGTLLQLPLYKDQGECLIYCAQGHGKIGFCTHHPSTFNDTSCITFVYETQEDVDAMYDYLVKHVDHIHPPSTNKTFDIYHFFCKDTQGLSLEFQVFLK